MESITASIAASAIAILMRQATEELRTKHIAIVEKLIQSMAEKYTKDPNTQSIVLLNACQELKARQKSLEELDDLDDLPEQDYRSIEADISTWHTRFIALLEDILPKEHHEEWLGDLREGYYQLIDDGTPLWKVYFITLLTGLGLIRSYLWLKADKFVSRWMTRAKKVFLG